MAHHEAELLLGRVEAGRAPPSDHVVATTLDPFHGMSICMTDEKTDRTLGWAIGRALKFGLAFNGPHGKQDPFLENLRPTIPSRYGKLIEELKVDVLDCPQGELRVRLRHHKDQPYATFHFCPWER